MTFRPAKNLLEPTWPAHGYRLRDTSLGLAKRLSSQPLGTACEAGCTPPPIKEKLALLRRAMARSTRAIMPAAKTYPGVYIEDLPNGVRAIQGVATAITAAGNGART